MPTKLSKNINKILFKLSLILIIVPVSGLAETAKEYPFHMGGTAEREITYPYSFENVWEAVLKVLQEQGENSKKILQKIGGFNELKTDILSDKKSGLVIYRFAASASFTSHIFIINALESEKTHINSHIVIYMFYGSPLLYPSGNLHPSGNLQKILARRLYLIPFDATHKKIEDKLKEKTK